MNSATAASQSFSGMLCHDLPLIIICLVAAQFVSRTGFPQRYLVTNPLAATASFHGVSGSNNVLSPFGISPVALAGRQAWDSSGKVRRDILARRRYVLVVRTRPARRDPD
jgi:hypothetical protein